MSRLILFCLGIILMHPPWTLAKSYFIDSRMPSDTLDGLKPERAWKSPEPLKRIKLRQGDSILFRKGGQWFGQRLVLDQGGRPGSPVFVGSYGPSNLPRPHLIDTSTQVLGIAANHIIVSGLKFSGARRYGISTLGRNRRSIELRNNEITNCTNGILIFNASQVLLADNYIHAIHYNRSTKGAVGIIIDNSANIEITDNIFQDCIGGVKKKHDGGAIELFRSNQNISVRKNRASNTWGFIEMGGLRNDTISDVQIDSNIAINTHLFAWFNLATPQDTSNKWGVGYKNITVSYNHFIQNSATITNPIGANTYLTDSSQIIFSHNSIGGDSLLGFIYKGGFSRISNRFWSPHSKKMKFKLHESETMAKPKYPIDTLHLIRPKSKSHDD